VDAFDRLFDRHRPALREVVARRLDPRLMPRVDISDVVQEAQLEAFNRLDDYLRRRPMPFRLWLLKTTHERLLKVERFHLNTAKRSLYREVPLSDHSSLDLARQLIADGTAPGDRASRHELARQMRVALGRLSERDREVIMLRNFDCLSTHEVSCILEISPDATKKRYIRALLRMQRVLRELGVTETEL
jgi:RNA polymerase sigma-70 factor (ECF subfamily)